MKALLILLLSAFSFSSMAQEIAGRIIDGRKDLIIGAEVLVYQGGVLRGSIKTDLYGEFVVKPLNPGMYHLVAISGGYDTVTFQDVIVSAESRSTQNIILKKCLGQSGNLVYQYKKPIDIEMKLQTAQEYANSNRLSGGSGDDMLTTKVGVYQSIRGQQENTGIVCRVVSQLYNIDGVIVQGTTIDYQIAEIKPFYPLDHGHYLFERSDILQAPVMRIDDLISLVPGAYEARRGDPTQFYGSRNTGNTYILDGMHVN